MAQQWTGDRDTKLLHREGSECAGQIKRAIDAETARGAGYKLCETCAPKTARRAPARAKTETRE
ncbi:MAG TPA: hypothetical protein VNN73_17455 [Blastocatellia bacterium]|nr:hypothetical protein [Blastocatellia bacterium]